MVLYSHDWTDIGFSFILITVNLFPHFTLIEHGLYMDISPKDSQTLFSKLHNMSYSRM